VDIGRTCRLTCQYLIETYIEALLIVEEVAELAKRPEVYATVSDHSGSFD